MRSFIPFICESAYEKYSFLAENLGWGIHKVDDLLEPLIKRMNQRVRTFLRERPNHVDLRAQTSFTVLQTCKERWTDL